MRALIGAETAKTVCKLEFVSFDCVAFAAHATSKHQACILILGFAPSVVRKRRRPRISRLIEISRQLLFHDFRLSWSTKLCEQLKVKFLYEKSFFFLTSFSSTRRKSWTRFFIPSAARRGRFNTRKIKIRPWFPSGNGKKNAPPFGYKNLPAKFSFMHY